MIEDDRGSNQVLEGIYHKGQAQAWDGKELLGQLVVKHGGVHLPNKEAAAHVLSLILWGELAAWNVAAELVGHFDSLSPKLAATAQAHDESRHFYVMYDYLRVAGIDPVDLPQSSQKMINNVLRTKSTAKKLLGMHLMVEPIALTLFREIRHSNVEPVLCELLKSFERDEARHVALGVYHLPALVHKMGPAALIDTAIWQLRMLMLEVDGLSEMGQHFRELGIDVNRLYDEAEKRQLRALEELSGELGWSPSVWEPIRKVIGFKRSWSFRSS